MVMLGCSVAQKKSISRVGGPKLLFGHLYLGLGYSDEQNDLPSLVVSFRA